LNLRQLDSPQRVDAVGPERAAGVEHRQPERESAEPVHPAAQHATMQRPAFDRDAIRRLEAPRIGVLNVPYYVDKVRRVLPQATVVQLNSITEFFEGKGEELDAFLYAAEAGSAWSLLYPAYTVAIPQPGVLKGPVAYPLPRGDRDLVDFINVWLELKKRDRTIEVLYDYWVLGKNAVPRQPRWSVIRNILHWVK
jgi:hypothetical protein